MDGRRRGARARLRLGRRSPRPVDCIHPTKEEAEFDRHEQLYIDPDECIDCDACVEACPVDAITPEDQVPPEWQRYIEINAAYFRERAEA
ncbi:MAG: ferredoxin family protein [Thermoleophilia bacterium]|nr:ferredoxin family protein [Thermoleophilia bacterium]